MDGDWIKLHRKSIDSRVFSDPFLWHLWCWCLMRANWKSGWKFGREVLPGQIVCGRRSAAEQLNCTPSRWYRGIQKLQEWGMITVKANRDFSVVTISNWETYQHEGGATRTTNEPPVNHQRTTDEPPANTIEEGKERKKEKKGRKKEETNVSVSGADGKPSSQEFFDRWNTFVSDKPTLKKVLKLSDARRKKIATRLRSSDWWSSFRSAVKMLPLLGEGWQPTFDWFIRNDENVYRLLEGEFDFRVEGHSAKKLAETRRKKAEKEREARIEKERQECKKNASGTRKAMDDIFSPEAGNGDENNDSSLLFG